MTWSRSPSELEAQYRTAPLGPLPRGCYAGRFLTWIDSRGARRWSVRTLDSLLFRSVRFGVDFDRRLWWFGAPRLGAGRFELSQGASRWRETETLRLTYGGSRLPRPLRSYLYDEVKSLDADRCLGIGGVDRETGEGDHFFFSLDRIS